MNVGWKNRVARVRSYALIVACALMPFVGGAYVYACSSIIRAGLS